MIKKVIILLLTSLHCIIGECHGQIKSRTDQVFELSGIAFRLAGAEEYTNNAIPAYMKDIDKHFSPYRNHDLIKFIKTIRVQNAIGYDAVMKAAALLHVKDGHVLLKPNYTPVDIVAIDDRWTEEIYAEYIDLIDDFYHESRFGKFYSEHEKLYKLATERLDEILCEINTGWFSSFFGRELGEPTVITALCNGYANYSLGPMLDMGIVLGSRADRNGRPSYPAHTVLPRVVHELSHGFSNELLDKAWNDSLTSAAITVYSYVGDAMQRIGYGEPGVMTTEWFNNLCEIMYFRENPTETVDLKRRIGIMQMRGFIWLKRSVEYMDGFYADRTAYPTIADYIPRLLSFFNDTAADLDSVIEEYDASFPYVAATYPESGAIIEDDEIIVRFSAPMFTHAYGLETVPEEGVLPVKTKNEFWRDSTTFVLPLKAHRLKKGATYGIRLNRHFFQSAENYPMREDYVYYFRTAGK